ncbi:MAG TPA: double zinc ribbon domain-containing protein [Gaiellaceae bacterium]|nr:double zinc ribbon domain-containing protein [Gaiellaceae bacterium]
MIEWLLELLLPSRCASCGVSGPLLCSGCRGSLLPIRPPLCALCGAPTAWPVARCRECAGRRLPFDSARAAITYTGPARALVRGWKERGLRPLTSVAADLVVEYVERPAADLITYIPPDGDRSLRRGQQPARALARELGRRWGIEVGPLLSRRGKVRRQAGLTLVERRRNMRGAFTAARPVPVAVALVDDVYTTGATVAAAAAALRTGGATRVEVVSLARAVR